MQPSEFSLAIPNIRLYYEARVQEIADRKSPRPELTREYYVGLAAAMSQEHCDLFEGGTYSMLDIEFLNELRMAPLHRWQDFRLVVDGYLEQGVNPGPVRIARDYGKWASESSRTFHGGGIESARRQEMLRYGWSFNFTTGRWKAPDDQS